MRDHGAVPATLGYRGYPKSCCISVNHVVNHGIPSEDKRLRDGDIANIDVTVHPRRLARRHAAACTSSATGRR